MPTNAVEEEFAAQSTSDRDATRELAQTSTYFMGKGILGYDQIDEAVHAPLCSYLDNDDSQYRMVLVFRGFLKSTICTITYPIKESVRNPESTRILIENELEDNSAAFLGDIKKHWETNILLRGLFPELIPLKLKGPGSWWNQTEACLNRKAIYKEATYTAMGAGGAAQSKHFTHIIPDDLAGERAKASRAVMTWLIKWNGGIRSLMDSLRKSRITWVGTRKTVGDVYQDIMEKYKGRLSVFIREPIENGESIFPAKFPLEELYRIMEEEPDVWYHDYMNNPIGQGGRDWMAGLVRFFELYDNGSIRYQHHLTEQWKTWTKEELDITITVDPNSGKLYAPDKAAIVVHGMSPERQIFILETWSERPSPTGLIQKLWETCQKWRPRAVGIEDAGQQNTLHYFNERCIDEGASYFVIPLSHKNKEKEQRIRTALDTPLKARRFYIQRNQTTLKGQIELFPQLAEHNWDELDAASYGPEIYLPGERTEDRKKNRDAAKRILAARGLTGYGDTIARPHTGLEVVSSLPSPHKLRVLRRLGLRK